MKLLLLTSLLGAAAGASSLGTYHLVHEVGGGGRYEMQVLPHSDVVVTLDHESGIVRYIYNAGDVPPAKWAIEMKPGSQLGQVTPADRANPPK